MVVNYFLKQIIMKITTLRKALFSMCFLLLLFSCKMTAHENSNHSTESIPNEKNIMKYLSITLNVPVEKILIDQKTQVFYIPNTQFRESIEKISLEYANANEYKAKYENIK